VTAPAPLIASPIAGVAIVLALFVALLLLVRLVQVVWKPHPELARKLFHMGGGIVAVTFPWLFAHVWPVALIAALSAGAFVLLRVVPRLHGGVGQVLGGVERVSWGEFCFVLAIVVLFPLSGRDPVRYGGPLLVLAVADTTAALVGRSYGKLAYATVEGGRKSAEGSSAFLLAAFFCIHVPLLLGTSTGRAESLLIAANVALMAMMAEAIAWKGLDNFFIPFFSFVFLQTYLSMGVWQLVLHFAVIAGLFLFTYFYRRQTNLAASGRLGGVLFGYTVWLLGGWQWLVPPLLLFAAYRALSRRVPEDATRHIDLFVVGAILLPSLAWVVSFAYTRWPPLYTAYVATYGAHMAAIALVRHKRHAPGVPWRRLVAENAARGAVIALPPLLLYFGPQPATLWQMGLCLLSVVVGTVLFGVLQRELDGYPHDLPRWVRQSIAATGASVLPLVASRAALAL
jgi:phytol kinase